MKKCLAILLSALLVMGCIATFAASAATIDTKNMDFTFTDRELEGEWDEREAISVVGHGDNFKANGKGVKLTDGQMLITAEGEYCLSGEFTMPVVIRVDDKDKVQLILNGAHISVADGPAIYIEDADKVFITLAEGTNNSVSDGAAYADTADGSPDAVIFSRDDLCIHGSGALTVIGQYKHGVVSKDDLVIVACTLNVTSLSTALDGKDCLMATGANITVDAGSNGLRSDNAEDENRGYIYLQDSTLNITAENDGVQAETVLYIENCTMNVTTGGGSGSRLISDTGSWKGLKSAGDMLIDGGSYTIYSHDDAIHSNSSIVIAGGDFTISSGDDGIHADTNLTITGGTFYVKKSYEGMEASKLTIAGGGIYIVASDDGLNAAGGNDGSAMGGRAGAGFFSNGVGEIIISGGYTILNASGDGIDSNGTIAISGGVTLVSGSTGGMNAAFDYDGSATVTGGILMALGSTGMAQNFSSAQNQGAMLVDLSSRQTEALSLVDASGNVIVSFKPMKNYQSAVITAPEIAKGQTYTLVVGGTVEGADEYSFARNTTMTGGTKVATVTMSSLIYGSGFGGFGGSGGGPSGGGGGW